MSGLVGNTFAFFMFNGEEYVSTKVVNQKKSEFGPKCEAQVRTTVGLVLLTITCAGVAVLLTLRFVSAQPEIVYFC